MSNSFIAKPAQPSRAGDPAFSLLQVVAGSLALAGARVTAYASTMALAPRMDAAASA